MLNGWSNERPALDAAMSFSLHIGAHWRRASDVQGWAARTRLLSSPTSAEV